MEQTSAAIRLTPDLVDPAVQAISRAFVDYPLMVYAVPDPEQRTRAVYSLYGRIVRYSLRHGEAYTTPAAEGAACWLPPEDPFPRFFPMLAVGMLAVPFRFGWHGWNRLHPLDDLANKLHHSLAGTPHWYLWAIGVDPAHQGRGAGGRLLGPMLERADASTVPCYLETHKEANVSFYERHGFRVTSRAELPGVPIPVWGMLRPAR